MTTAGKKDPRAEPEDDADASGVPEQATHRPPPDEQAADERPIDIAIALRAAKTAAALGRAPVPQETAKMGAFDLAQALAKLSNAEEEKPPPSRSPTVRPKEAAPLPGVEAAEIEPSVTKKEDVSGNERPDEEKVEPPAEEGVGDARSEEQREAEKPDDEVIAGERPKSHRPIPVPGPPEAARVGREAPRKIPRSTLLLIFLAVVLLAGLYAWSQTLR